MTDVRLRLSTVFALLAIVGAGAFAAGRAMPGSSAASTAPAAPAPQQAPAATEGDDMLPPGHPSTAGAGGSTAGALPAGHPAVGATDPAGIGPGTEPAAQPTLEWKAPARWQSAPNTSSMRLATFRIPHVQGDSVDPELSIIRAGGTVEANADRWVGQFDAAGQKTAKRTVRKVGAFDVTIVEVEGTYSGGMGKDSGPASGWALLGAIVPTPEMPHFFKLTGPAKSVAAARADFDAFVGSVATR